MHFIHYKIEIPHCTNSLGYIRNQQLVNNVQSMVRKKKKQYLGEQNTTSIFAVLSVRDPIMQFLMSILMRSKESNFTVLKVIKRSCYAQISHPISCRGYM